MIKGILNRYRVLIYQNRWRGTASENCQHHHYPPGINQKWWPARPENPFQRARMHKMTTNSTWSGRIQQYHINEFSPMMMIFTLSLCLLSHPSISRIITVRSPHAINQANQASVIWYHVGQSPGQPLNLPWLVLFDCISMDTTKTLQNVGELGRKCILTLIHTFHLMDYVSSS